MLLATLGGLMWPAITRMPILSGRFVPMFALLVGLGILATFPLRVVIGTSAPWRTFAAWVVQ